MRIRCSSDRTISRCSWSKTSRLHSHLIPMNSWVSSIFPNQAIYTWKTIKKKLKITGLTSRSSIHAMIHCPSSTSPETSVRGAPREDPMES